MDVRRRLRKCAPPPSSVPKSAASVRTSDVAGVVPASTRAQVAANEQGATVLSRHALFRGLNSDELALLAGKPASQETAREFLQRHGLRGLLVTRGARGAQLLLAGGECLQVAPQPGTEVVDSVGAGDAFAAVMLLGLLREWPMPLTLERAQHFAAALVGRRGATVAELDFYRTFSRQWQLGD